jgi:hypothetical protein
MFCINTNGIKTLILIENEVICYADKGI